MNRRDILKGALGAAVVAGVGATMAEKVVAQMVDGDAEKKRFLIEECGMKYNHLGIPTQNDMPWEAYLENLKLHIMEYANDPFGIEWMKFEEGSPMPEMIQKFPHVAFTVNDIAKAAKGFKELVPLSHPREGMTTLFIEHKGIAIEFIMLDGEN